MSVELMEGDFLPESEDYEYADFAEQAEDHSDRFALELAEALKAESEWDEVEG